MNKFLLSALLLTNILLAQNTKRKLLWQEEFNSVKLDENVWNFELNDGCPNLCGWGNNERQNYTQENHYLKDGNLVIEARMSNGNYTSTRITTKGKKQFKYGRIEVRAKLPKGAGLWPAFWMLGSNITQVGWPKCGEIDILEYIGKEPGMVFTSLHTQESHGNTVNTKKTKRINIERGFHRYAVDWTKDKIEFFIDGRSVYAFSPEIKNENNWPYDQPFYMIINLAIGGNFGGSQIDDSILPQSFVIDYIKVFQ